MHPPADARQDEPDAASARTTLARQFIAWLYQPRAHLNWIWRLTAVLAVPLGIVVAYWSQGGPGPYNVPAWSFGRHLFALPHPPTMVTTAIFWIYGAICLAMALGWRARFAPLMLAAVLCYYGSLDMQGSTYSFFCVITSYLIALSFDHPKHDASAARRLIQISVTCCYFFAALQKALFPEFLNGTSLEAATFDGWALNQFWAPIISHIHIPHLLFQLVGPGTVVLEMFLAFGLWFRCTRMPAVIVGTIFHGIILMTMDYFMAFFGFVMWTGFLAFFPGKQLETEQGADTVYDAQANVKSVGASVEKCLATAFIAFMVLVPLRIYFWANRPCTMIYFMDRSPWTYQMVLMRFETKSVSAEFEDAAGWHSVPDIGRMKSASTDNELYAMANYLFETYPSARRVKIKFDLLINNHWHQIKNLAISRNGEDANLSITNTIGSTGG